MDSLATIIVALGGVLVTLAVFLGLSIVFYFWSGMRESESVQWTVLAAVIASINAVPVILAVRGHRLAAGIEAAIGWPAALFVLLWLFIADPFGATWLRALAAGLGLTLFALAVTFLAIRGRGATARVR